MNKISRLNKIEKVLVSRNVSNETVVLNDINGKYYMKKDGRRIEVDKNDASYKDKLVIILKSYGIYDLQEDIK